MRDEVACCRWVVEVCLSWEGLDLSQSENESKPASSTEREGEFLDTLATCMEYISMDAFCTSKSVQSKV